MIDSGLMIGHFQPLHLGQMRSILAAAGQVKSLYIVITSHPAPHPDYLKGQSALATDGLCGLALYSSAYL
mgnify:CR=1 FL=1